MPCITDGINGIHLNTVSYMLSLQGFNNVVDEWCALKNFICEWGVLKKCMKGWITSIGILQEWMKWPDWNLCNLLSGISEHSWRFPPQPTPFEQPTGSHIMPIVNKSLPKLTMIKILHIFTFTYQLTMYINTSGLKPFFGTILWQLTACLKL